jgi:predicted enzyme related to lactoylglutathione lyase
MTLHVANVTFDCGDTLAVARFWSAALGRPVDPDASEYFASIGLNDGESPNWYFAKVPESKTAKNRVHIDFASDDRDREAARLVELGATRGADHDEWGHSWTVMADPEGNEFCVGQAAEPAAP